MSHSVLNSFVNELLDSIIGTTTVCKTVVEALKNLKPGERLVINTIRKKEIDKDYLLKVDYLSHLLNLNKFDMPNIVK